MAANALKKITTEAQKIRKKSPGISWKSAVKKAGAKYRASAKTSKKPVRKKAAKKVARRSVKRKTVGTAPVVIQRDTVQSHVGAAKKLLLDSLGKLEGRKFAASTKTDKRKLQKSINHTKAQIRRLSLSK